MAVVVVVVVVVGGRVAGEWGVVERERFLCAAEVRRRVAGEGVGEGASLKRKNLRKAPRRRRMESWPRRKPWLKERLVG